MSAETELFAALRDSAAVGALINDKIYPDALPQEVALPAVVYQRTGTDKIRSIHGTTLGERSVLLLQVLGEVKVTAESIADACEAALEAANFVPTGRASGMVPDTDTRVIELTVEHHC